jgi:hypothetical protein
MNQRRRMFGTLACLAVSMTGTAFLLGWIDPTRPVLAVPLTSEDDGARAVDHLLRSTDFRAEAWSDVEVMVLRVDAAGRLDPAIQFFGAHLYVDSLGRVAYHEWWLNQIAPPDRPGTVRIVAVLGEGEHSMTRRQRQVVDALAHALAGRIRDGRGVHPRPRFIDRFHS